MALFELGQVVITRAAMAFCDDNKVHPVNLVQRHAGGDWGDLTHDDVEANVAAVRHDLRIFSSYKFPVGKVWVITEADRSSTCVLLPDGLLTHDSESAPWALICSVPTASIEN